MLRFLVNCGRIILGTRCANCYWISVLRVSGNSGWRQMRKSLLASVSLGALVFASGSQAADIAARPAYEAPAMAPAPWSWAGFYVGANVGAAFARGSIADDPTSFVPWLNGSSFNNNSAGVIGGLEAGYNWQWASLVLGIEADISASSLNHSVSFPVPFGNGTPDVYSSKLS